MKNIQICIDVSNNFRKKISCSYFISFSDQIYIWFLSLKMQMLDFYGTDFIQSPRRCIQKSQKHKISFSCFRRYIRYCEHGSYRIMCKTGHFLFCAFLAFYLLGFLIKIQVFNIFVTEEFQKDP